MLLSQAAAQAGAPASLQMTGVPDLPTPILDSVNRYESAQASYFMDWDPNGAHMLIGSLDGGIAQLHVLLGPNGESRLPTLFHGNVAGGSFMPRKGDFVIFAADHDGDEFYQLYALNAATGTTRMLTDGESLNVEPIFGHDGFEIAYCSTMLDRKNGDIYVTDPRDPHSTRMLMKIDRGGWMLQDWAHDDHHILAIHDISPDSGYLWSIDTGSGETRLLTKTRETQRCYLAARYTPHDDALWVVVPGPNEAAMISWLPLDPAAPIPKIPAGGQKVRDIELSPDGTNLAYLSRVENELQLHVFNTQTGVEEPADNLPCGLISHVRWNADGTMLGFSLGGADLPTQACSYSLSTHRMTQWTATGLAAASPARTEPQLVSIRSFDNLPISGYFYRPDPARFPGPRPVIVDIHGGPAIEYVPSYSPTINFYVNELGVAMLYPNVRGSAGFGERFADLDNGFQREDAVKDIGAFLDWIAADPNLDNDRVAVRGASYGGYMTLASLYHYSNRLRCGSDMMGITDFVTFLKNTEIYRQANRRAEYGDERYPDMNRFLQSISPLNHVAEIADPVMITAGKNDPRVPVSESEQMVAALRAQNKTVWYILGESEGHGFRRADDELYQEAAEALFFETYLLPKKRLTPLLPEAPAAPVVTAAARDVD